MRTLTHGEYLAMKRFPALDGMRAIAAVMVVFFHYAGPQWARLNGWIGVHLFFVLSGYLITTLALREESRNGRISIRDFYVRRAFRILPVYYVVLGIVVAFAWLRHEYTSSGLASVMPFYLTFTNEFAPPGQVFGQSWTLGVEQKFYLVWPALMFTIGAFTLKRRLPMTLGLMALAAVGHFMEIPYVSPAAYFMIISGCLLAFLLHSPRSFGVLRPFTHPLVSVPALAAAVVVQTNIGEIDALVGGTGGLLPVALYGLSVGLLIVSTLRGGPIQWLLSLRPMAFVGDRSYSLYLIQGVAGTVVALSIPALAVHRTAAGIAVTLVSLLMADLLFRWVEQPMIDQGRKLIRKLNERKAARAAADVPERQPELATTSA
ncbi:acyltransferase family protein [Lentzea flaviverrucosa]|uniref:Peptidoglycan/LPS O-acetylase OafA/YrhL, contains acyltransferase and SGNH-hydrolase domains n=1 Tax=Lentzea flaviverrucosa TaxID=200379 RepID=A0A1H9XVA3_9PSEU|nr:acyltransferase [Lentzea flaviverrucosa]RDI18703.1 peptidoglycan/LPS O-acetylase OafA/YrhL [Lentzea flaviverrucosa]SES50056.1 Peptidoglycan/LPS O-acetylase OafA/YrhL, contains acyltransferase and SGNH-hydrolase domains [Lentzea flaviverrucosa]